ncbi:peptidylprolyl isomerase [Cryobacterium psychrophilum]|uniref:peptidylprolyl isomerase n=1 Tax=Cryobacterium psychrophilum TaxID=41988 RepID=A0A4Y8KMH3_9MICO|nr:peptidylprolyl isomerase [Cryobacterium psychrophilum]TDW31444.1 peptidyl-prolyl cis-trans isomerase B (cyclophilin B) [Cryobacterium psychrophilum]TFD78883.1 peptidylprolyl isomerase [Cryobacterium psychrophilum]
MAQNYKQEREARAARARTRAFQARRDVHEHQQKRRVRDNILAGAGLVVVVTLLVVAQVFYFNGGPGSPEPTDSAAAESSTTPGPATVQNSGDVPSSTIAEGRTWSGTLTLNDVDLGIELDGAAAPQAVSSTISLAQTGFYVDTSCHRLTKDGFFVLQCGDPNGDGSGGPDYRYGPVENAPADNIYPAGTLAMARQGDSAFSQGSQFFIVYEDTTIGADTAGGYSVIGQVTSGLDELKSQITDAGTIDDSADGSPTIPTTITGITVQ